jgi:hypothetical protein
VLAPLLLALMPSFMSTSEMALVGVATELMAGNGGVVNAPSRNSGAMVTELGRKGSPAPRLAFFDDDQ